MLSEIKCNLRSYVIHFFFISLCSVGDWHEYNWFSNTLKSNCSAGFSFKPNMPHYIYLFSNKNHKWLVYIYVHCWYGLVNILNLSMYMYCNVIWLDQRSRVNLGYCDQVVFLGNTLTGVYIIMQPLMPHSTQHWWGSDQG